MRQRRGRRRWLKRLRIHGSSGKQISVQPVGSESQAKAVASNLDEGIEKNYRAALISNGLDKQHVSFNAKNGLLLLTGSVRSAGDKQRAEKLAAGIPNVRRIMNQLEFVDGKKQTEGRKDCYGR